MLVSQQERVPMEGIMLGNFDHISRGTRISQDSRPGVAYVVGDLTTRTVNGKEVTALILSKLNAKGFNAGERKRVLTDTSENRATWTRI